MAQTDLASKDKPAFIHLVAGARPNFMKIAPLYHALSRESWCRVHIVHTGQHYDYEMSAHFFSDLDLPAPDISLQVGSGSHAEQTGAIMVAYEKVCLQEPPDLVVVVGDVNSTMACALVAKKLCIRVAHLEAGLRSFDESMPEEINRVVTDRLADVLWTPSEDADENLLREGVETSQIVRVGNIMIDSFEMLRERIVAERAVEKFGFAPQQYAVVTLHRPSNVDDPNKLEALLETLDSISKQTPLIFPLHPRTRKRLEAFSLLNMLENSEHITCLAPLGYVQFMSLVSSARFVITDSGGVQEETTYLGIPCITLRPNTERPITIAQGTNCLVDHSTLRSRIQKVLSDDVDCAPRKCPEYWDGKTAARIVDNLRTLL